MRAIFKNHLPEGKLFRIAFLLICTIYAALVSGQKVQVDARIERSQAVIGDQLKFNFEIHQPQHAKVLFPLFADSIVNMVEIIDRKPVDTTKSPDGSLVLKQELTISSFDSGSYSLGPFYFKFEIDGQIDSVPSPVLNLYVNSIPIDTTKSFVDIKPPIDTPLTFKEIVPYILLGILILAIAFAAYWFYLSRKKKKPAFGFLQKPKEPAHVIALRDLDLLKDKKLWQQDRVKEYHSEVSDIIRRYIEHRFLVHAMEQTTDEIMASLCITRLVDSLNEEKLKQILITADLVKFAKFIPLADENDLSMRNAYAFVLQSKESISLLDPEKGEKTDKTL